MVIDAAKGIEPQTRKLFEVCRLRDIPIITFVNKMDREARDPFELLDEIARPLALDVAPDELADRHGPELPGRVRPRQPPTAPARPAAAAWTSEDVVPGARQPASSMPRARRAAGASCARSWRWSRALCRPFDSQSYREGHLTPVFFGSALQQFRRPRAARRARRATRPRRGRSRPSQRTVEPDEDKVTGLRVQGPGEHGPQAPRPGRVRAPVLGPLPARHEAQHGPRTASRSRSSQPDLLLRPRARDRRGGLARRHHRHPQPRQAPRRRRADARASRSASPASRASRPRS